MQIMDSVSQFFLDYVRYLRPGISDVIEIIIIAFLFYHVIIWFKKTRAWALFKGIIIIIVFILLAAIFNLTTILWLAEKLLAVGVLALVILFQPELRRALEQLGRRSWFVGLFTSKSEGEGGRFSDKTLNEIVKTCVELSKTKTGALICIERESTLNEYIRTGITIDAIVTNQLLINTFEKNTPLHDGAVVIRGDRVVAATCYLPMSDNMELSKELGTRHRAAVGLSEATDSAVIVVSEETGDISLSVAGELVRKLDGDSLKAKLQEVQNKVIDVNKMKFWKRRGNDEDVQKDSSK